MADNTYFYCVFGKHIWPAWDRTNRPTEFIRRVNCAECSKKQLTIRMRAHKVGDSCLGFEANNAEQFKWKAAKERKRKEKLSAEEFEFEKKALKKNPAHVTLEEARRMWEGL